MTVAFDPITYEVLRHRLIAINDEAASTIALVSGSPVASEAFDFNSALMNSEGDVVVVGHYIVAHAAAMDLLVRYVVKEHSQNPGFGPGDMFMTNDPFIAAMHQPDVVVVAPIFVEGELVAWCGNVVHQTDVGGPVAGGVAPGARSIFEEAIPLAPIRIVEGGQIRKDLEREFLIRSRTPGLAQLDMRAQIAANKVHTVRFSEICAGYRVDTVVGCMDWLVKSTARQFEQRLLELPDGTWSHSCFVEHDGVNDRAYKVGLELRKHATLLELDFTASDEQAPALINCSRGTLNGYILGTLLPQLAYDMPWVPSSLWRFSTILTKPGSVVDARWPAGVSMGNSSAGHAARTCVNVCISKMLDASDSHRDRAVASCMAYSSGQNISGLTTNGEVYGTLMFDSLAGGGGARCGADGIDTACIINAPASSISNIEAIEHNYPIRYLWRRQLPDSAGAGRYRGGVGGEHAFVLHSGRAPMTFTCFGSGVDLPALAGLAGGEPGQPSSFRVVRSVASLVHSPADLVKVQQHIETLPPKLTSELAAADVYIQQYSGGGGYGDPISRPPAQVCADVAAGLVSLSEAAQRYFAALVVGEHGDVSVDAAGTQRLRDQERSRRIRLVASEEPAESSLEHDGDDYRCANCGLMFKWANLLSDRCLVPQRWPLTLTREGGPIFAIIARYCPGCAERAEVNVVLSSNPCAQPDPQEVVQ